MHIFPQLRKLERKYRESLVVVGVHSSKFPNERQTRNVRNAVLRYEIEHPVVNDAEFRIWQEWGVRAWPTLMFVDPRGKVIGKHEGEFPFSAFDRVIGEMVAEFDRAGILHKTPLSFQLEAEAARSGVLYFPGKVEADVATGRLFIADSNHNRVLVTDLEGKVQTTIGSGEIGAADGDFDSASFWHPQGMCLVGESLYIADAENHNIRRAVLRQAQDGQILGSVETVAGTGEQSLYRHEGGEALGIPLNSPYDIAHHEGFLYVSMAGFHQVWAFDIAAGRVYPYAGDGVESIGDGPRLAAHLAQPYGIKSDGRRLYFADSETSALRSVGLPLRQAGIGGEDQEVVTHLGKGLFEFGDRDGPADQALLQHVQGLALGEGVVYLADTYNHKIKVYDPGTGMVRTLAGTGAPGRDDGPALTAATFDEPAGLALAGKRLYVADTNNHQVRVVDLGSKQVSTLDVRS